MNIRLSIRTDNAAFADGNEHTEVGRILRKVASEIVENGIYADSDPGILLDVNGNRCGRVVTSIDDNPAYTVELRIIQPDGEPTSTVFGPFAQFTHREDAKRFALSVCEMVASLSSRCGDWTDTL